MWVCLDCRIGLKGMVPPTVGGAAEILYCDSCWKHFGVLYAVTATGRDKLYELVIPSVCSGSSYQR